MSQALPVLSSPPPRPTAAGAAQPPETADSGRNFEAALASQRDAGGSPAPAGAEMARSGSEPIAAPAGAGDPGSESAAVAATGKDLPPALPPDPLAVVAGLTLPPADRAELPAPAAMVPAAADAVPVPVLAVSGPVLAAIPVPAAGAAAPVPDPAPGAPAPGPRPAAVPVAASATASRPDAGLPLAPPVLSARAPAGGEPLPMLRPERRVAETAGAPLEARAGLVAVAGLAAAGGPPAAASGVALPAAPGGHIGVPLQHPGWGQAFGQQVVWAVSQGLPAAALHLSPPELGPLSVQIRIDQDQASIQFVSAHASVREAIEAALPRLREMLGGQGIALADVNVAPHGQSGDARREPAAANGGRRGDDEAPAAEDLGAVTIGRAGLLDVYA